MNGVDSKGINKAVLALNVAVRDAAYAAAHELGKDLPDNMTFPLEHPKHEGQGDRASNAAMQLAKTLGRPPRDIAAKIAELLQGKYNDAGLIEKVEVAGPGFINLFLSKKWFALAASSV